MTIASAGMFVFNRQIQSKHLEVEKQTNRGELVGSIEVTMFVWDHSGDAFEIIQRLLKETELHLDV